MITYFEDEAQNLALLTDKQRLEYIIQKGDTVPTLEPQMRTDETKVEGCQSNAYLVVDAEDDTVKVRTAADSRVVQGYLAFLSEGLTGQAPSTVVEEAQSSVKAFVEQGELSSTFTPNRSDVFTNTVNAITESLRDSQ